MKSYTPIRRFYAWIGFSVIWGAVILAILFIALRFCVPQNDSGLLETRDAMAQEIDPVQVPAVVTAYTSSVDETDSTPNVNAAGTHPHNGSVACPSKYSFGTQVQIDGKTYICDDRMSANRRGDSYFDIWVHTKSEAFYFGKEITMVTII